MDGKGLIADYIRKNTTQAQFARAAECSESHLTLFLQGERNLSVRLAKRFSAATGGTVPVQALVTTEIAELMGEAAE